MRITPCESWPETAESTRWSATILASRSSLPAARKMRLAKSSRTFVGNSMRSPSHSYPARLRRFLYRLKSERNAHAVLEERGVAQRQNPRQLRVADLDRSEQRAAADAIDPLRQRF